jgi:hypothetical protein
MNAPVRHLALLVCISMAGCKLIDQTTFAPTPEAKPPPVAARPAPMQLDPRKPLVVIDFTIPDPPYQPILRYAVRAAEARDSAVEYDVVTVTPSLEQATGGQAEVADVMRTMLEEKVPASRIHLGLRSDPGLAANQVRVYVR